MSFVAGIGWRRQGWTDDDASLVAILINDKFCQKISFYFKFIKD